MEGKLVQASRKESVLACWMQTHVAVLVSGGLQLKRAWWKALMEDLSFGFPIPSYGYRQKKTEGSRGRERGPLGSVLEWGREITISHEMKHTRDIYKLVPPYISWVLTSNCFKSILI